MVNSAVSAGDWTITPRVSAQVNYSDNINLAPKTQESEDFVTDISPSVSIRGEGRRLQLNFDYLLQALRYQRNSGSNAINHQLQADANAELVKQMVFLDARATAGQANTTNVGENADSNISVTDNRSDVNTYSVSPVFKHHLGGYLDTELRYTFDEVRYDAPDQDSSEDRIDATVRSGRRFTRLPWSLEYSNQEIDNDGRGTTEFERITADLRYVMNRRWSVLLNAGRDSNDFATSQSDNSGTSWGIGAGWTPTPRSSLDVGYGERFFGSNWFFNLTHRSRRTIWTASYDEDISTTREDQLQRELIPLVDAFGDSVIDPSSGNAVEIPVDIATSTDEVLVRKRLQASVDLRGRRTDANLSLFNERREYQITGDIERVAGISAGLNRRLSRKTTLGVSGSWQETGPLTSAQDDQRWDIVLTLSRQIGRDANGTLAYRHTKRDATESADDYTENRLTLGLGMSF